MAGASAPADKEEYKMCNNNGKFNPQNHLMKVKGKDYLEVKYRVHWFRQEKPDWDIQTRIIQVDIEKGLAIVQADIFDEEGKHKSSGIQMEEKRTFPDYLAKAETASIGRALACLGYGTLQCFELEEGIEKGRFVDAPVSLNGDKGNGKTVNQTEKEQGQSQQENKGNNGKVKATMMQIRYLKDLCKNLDIKPAVDLAGLSSEKASRYISDLEKMRKLAVKV